MLFYDIFIKLHEDVILRRAAPGFVIARRPQADVAISCRHRRFGPTAVKNGNSRKMRCSGAQRAPCRLTVIAVRILWRKAPKFVIPRSEATWESRRTRLDHMVLPAKTQLPSRDCHVGRWPPRNDTSGKREVRQRPHAVELPSTRRSLSAATPQTSVHAILTMPCTSRRFTAGPGCPLPYSTPRPAGFFSLYHIPREKSTLSEKSGLSP